ncbi:MAG TPA: hypothetical protein VLW45_13050 [Pelomicrobium sp.]|nr:hypothetical protein [Pelomicrobium sp.]
MRRTVALGVVVAVLYGALFYYEGRVMASFTRTDGVYWLLPVVTAFVFSIAHGAFTGHFWELLGVRGKPAAGEKQ